jgi:hypothetical protein
MSSSFIFGALFNLSLSIVAIVFISLLVDNNASNQLKSLVFKTDTLMVQVNQTSQTLVPKAQSDQAVIESIDLDACISERNSKCNNYTQNVISIQAQASIKTIATLNQTLQNVITSCNEQMNSLRDQINAVNTTNPVPILRSNGTFGISIGGGGSGVYEIYTWTFEDFKMDYLLIKPWNVNNPAPLIDPIISLNTFSPALKCITSEGIKPFVLSSYWNVNVTEYEATCNEIKLYVLGAVPVGIISQNKSLLI